MLKQGFAREGSMTRFMQPLSPGNRAAIQIWNRLGGELKWPALHYELELAGVDDVEMMLARLYCLQRVTQSGR